MPHSNRLKTKLMCKIMREATANRMVTKEGVIVNDVLKKNDNLI